MLKIYGANLSSPSNKVRMAAHVLDIDYNYIQVSLRDGEHRKKSFLELNPAGKVPVIVDDDFVLFESDAIIKYLTNREVSSLYPEDYKQRAMIDQWMSFSTVHVGGAMGRVLFNRVFASFAKVPVDERSLADGLKFMSRFLPVLDGQLNKHSYLAGPEFSLADISLLATLDPAETAQVDLAPFESLVKWRKQLMRKDFYMKCHASYEEALKTMLAGAR